MMERVLLGVFYLSGWHISSCLLHQYHYVADHMNWTEAQTYCRETYTDLATIDNTKEMKRLVNTVSSFVNHSVFWIGLYSNVDWRWSDGYSGSGAEYRNWETNQVTDELCVTTGSSGQEWQVHDCSSAYPSMCDNGTLQDPKFVYVNEHMNWSNAQRYCRENFRDLATVRNDTENQEIKSLVPPGEQAWIGLFGSPISYWSDGSSSSFRNWDNDKYWFGWTNATRLCSAAFVWGAGKWWLWQCGTILPFVCYSVPPNPVRQVVKLRIKMENSSVDLKADILKKLEDRLKEKGVSGATLKWRERPDGRVFHKETENSQKELRRKTEF